jgi:hypothetical protein
VDDIEAIKQLKARYMRAVDTKDWALCREVLADDFAVDTGFQCNRSAEDVVHFFETRLVADVATVHHVHAPEIELTSETMARGVWAYEEHARYPDGRWMDGYGYHHETYEKVDGVWKMKTQTNQWVYKDMRGLEVPEAT